MGALNDLAQVDERFLSMARRKWWKYAIAREFTISPQDVEGWDVEDIMEALANMAIAKAHRAKNKGGKGGKGG